jgi:hypothetical protein
VTIKTYIQRACYSTNRLYCVYLISAKSLDDLIALALIHENIANFIRNTIIYIYKHMVRYGMRKPRLNYLVLGELRSDYNLVQKRCTYENCASITTLMFTCYLTIVI